MTRSTLFDRLNHELEVIGRKAQAALDEGKVQIELLRTRRRRDATARDLGLLIYRRERGTEIESRRVEALLLKLDELEGEIARLQRQLADARQHAPSAQPPTPKPEPPQPAAGPAAV
jgi:hypothetical protein